MPVDTWDLFFIFLLLLGAWAGWRLKSLILLGLGFAFALAPLAGRAWAAPLGKLLIEDLGGKGLAGRQDWVAYWLIFNATALGLFLLFRAFSGMLKALQLEGLDRAFGSAMLCAILLSILSLNLKAWSSRLGPEARSEIQRSKAWFYLHPGEAPAWAEKVEKNLPDLSKIAPETSGHSRKKAAHR